MSAASLRDCVEHSVPFPPQDDKDAGVDKVLVSVDHSSALGPRDFLRDICFHLEERLNDSHP